MGFCDQKNGATAGDFPNQFTVDINDRTPLCRRSRLVCLLGNTGLRLDQKMKTCYAMQEDGKGKCLNPLVQLRPLSCKLRSVYQHSQHLSLFFLLCPSLSCEMGRHPNANVIAIAMSLDPGQTPLSNDSNVKKHDGSCD